MFARLALESEMERVVEMGAANVAETLPGEPCDRDCIRALFQRYLDTANPTFFVVDDHQEVIGFMLAGVAAFDYKAGFYTVQKVLYVSPEKRGTRAAVLLVRELIAWSKRLGAIEIVGGNDNGFRSERTAGFLEKFGFRKTGYAMTKRLSES